VGCSSLHFSYNVWKKVFELMHESVWFNEWKCLISFMKVPIILRMKLYVFMVNSSIVILTFHTRRWLNMWSPKYVNHCNPQFSIHANKCTIEYPTKYVLSLTALLCRCMVFQYFSLMLNADDLPELISWSYLNKVVPIRWNLSVPYICVTYIDGKW
jgi:hypothetical protein